MFLGRVTVGGGVDLDGWSEVRLVTTAAGDWSAVRWVAAAGDWLEVRWVATEGGWLAVRWLAGEDNWLEVRWDAGGGDWLEVRWVAAAEFISSWPKYRFHLRFGQTKCWLIHLELIPSCFGHQSLLF